MKRLLIKEITGCIDCPHSKVEVRDRECKHPMRSTAVIVRPYSIPIDCPLPVSPDVLT